MELQALHRELWLGELARTGSHDKETSLRRIIGNNEYNQEMMNETTLYNSDCAACQEAQNRMDLNKRTYGDRCPFCPLKWGRRSCCNDGTIYMKWCDADDLLERKMWAMQIGFMEWR